MIPSKAIVLANGEVKKAMNHRGAWGPYNRSENNGDVQLFNNNKIIKDKSACRLQSLSNHNIPFLVWC